MLGADHPMITDNMASTLGSYVYVYIDPRNGKPFYVGRGKGNRFLTHLDDRSDTEKVARIDEMRAEEIEPQIDFLRYGLTDAQAILVEAAAIDLIGLPSLTNRVSGGHLGTFGRIRADELLAIIGAEPVEVVHKAILITINQSYRSGMTERELYESTRGIWRVGKRREKAEYAMAVYQGVVREVYRVGQWHRACTLPYETRDFSGAQTEGRWEFEGEIAIDVRAEYVGKSVGKGGQNPIRYCNVQR